MSDSAGAYLKEHVDDALEGRDYLESRRRFVEAALASKKQARGLSVRWAIVPTAMAAAAMVAALAVHSMRTPITFSVGPSRVSGTVSEYIVSSGGDEVPLYFSDGSVVTLATAARARVDRTTAQGAAVLVEAGTVSANIVHRTNTDWTFFAGPYSVRVTGTAFVLVWDSSGVLDIRMKAGAVVVHGPDARQGVEVRDHARFTTSTNPSPPAGSAFHDEASRSASDRAAAERATPEVPDGPTSAVAERKSAPGLGQPDPSWSTLVARGEYSRVIELAERRGVDSTLAGATVDDLGALADAARFTGATNLAERTLIQTRSRFPSAPRAQAAAFLLGRLADDAGNAAGAVNWYERYLREAPGGPLAAEALGRRMLSRRRLNDPENTTRAAKEYLEKFPAGPYAGVAREIIGP